MEYCSLAGIFLPQKISKADSYYKNLEKSYKNWVSACSYEIWLFFLEPTLTLGKFDPNLLNEIDVLSC